MKAIFKKITFVVALVCFVALLFTLASINVSAESPDELVGDIYTDGSINSKDAVYLLKALAYIVELDNNTVYLANTYVEDNGDDGVIKINSRDALVLLQRLALMDVKLGEGEWKITKTPTPQEVGGAKRNTAKGNEVIELPVLDETNYKASVTKQPLCNALGEKTYAYYDVNNQKVLDLKFDIPMIECNIVIDAAVAPTCDKSGFTEGSHCSMCNKVVVAQQAISELGHKYNQTDWKCTVCGVQEFTEYNNYDEFFRVCNVTQNGNVVTLVYNQPEAVGLNLNFFALNPSNTYVFEFGPNAGKAKLASNLTEYSNVKVKVANRSSAYDLTLYNVSFINASTIISSNANTLNINFYGACNISCTQAASGSDGASYGAFQIGNGGNGTNGANGVSPINAPGIINILCAGDAYIQGGSGGNGGNGGNSNSSGRSGGNGGHGGNGAVGIYASQINVKFANNKTKDNLAIYGGLGGSGGSGGTGSAVLGIGKINKGDPGNSGASALATNISIIYS